MKLEDVLQKHVIETKFQKPILENVIHYKRNSTDYRPLNKLMILKPLDVFSAAMTVWNRIVYYGYHKVERLAVSKLAGRFDPRVHEQISQIIGAQIIREYYFVEYTIDDDSLNYKTVAELAVAEIYPETIYLADVLISNPYEPIPEKDQKYTHQEYRGLGLLAYLMERIETYARQSSFKYITLTAASLDQVKLFERHGFSVENNEFAETCMQLGATIPMEKEIV